MASREHAAQFSAIEAALAFKPKAIREHLKKFSSIDQAFNELLRQDPATGELLEKSYSSALKVINFWGQDVSILRNGESEYPSLLAKTPNPPEFLFVRGNVSLLSQKGAAVVGSRGASEDGKVRAFRIARMLVENNFVVFSGLAKGIDTAAHLGALKANGHTVAVIGTSIDKHYPKENKDLQDVIAQKGAVVSQFSPLRAVQSLNFPMRNEVMSGLSLATIIVEASETSGALIQAKQCLRQQRFLYIMKNQIDRTDLSWPREFLKKGAKAMTDFTDLLKDLKSDPSGPEGGQLRLI